LYIKIFFVVLVEGYFGFICRVPLPYSGVDAVAECFSLDGKSKYLRGGGLNSVDARFKVRLVNEM
jgi:hypothetical protein